MNVLSKSDLDFFRQQGYVIVPQAVPASNLQATVDAIWEFLEADDPEDPESWYRMPTREASGESPLSATGMVEIYNHQALWDNRQHPRVYQAFVDILGMNNLWVSLDRANMKPPVLEGDPNWQHPGMIHWDIETDQEITFGVQGVLLLTDTSADQGGFQCVPGFPRQFPEWVKTQPADRNPRAPDLTELEVKSIPGRAGDLLIWDSLLPHGNGRNTSDRPRLAQYIAMGPAKPENENQLQERIATWREVKPIKSGPGDPRGWESQRYGSAKLTDLGRRLLGLDAWPSAEVPQ